MKYVLPAILLHLLLVAHPAQAIIPGLNLDRVDHRVDASGYAHTFDLSAGPAGTVAAFQVLIGATTSSSATVRIEVISPAGTLGAQEFHHGHPVMVFSEFDQEWAPGPWTLRMVVDGQPAHLHYWGLVIRRDPCFMPGICVINEGLYFGQGSQKARFACRPGRYDLDGEFRNGCESRSATKSCPDAAPAIPHGEARCQDGQWQIGHCDAGFSDCNTLMADGCEVDTGSDSASCGGCGQICYQGEHCLGGACHLSCTEPSPQYTTPGLNATFYCEDGAWWLDRCTGGFEDCEERTPGCEIAVREDPDNCGACGRVCPSGICLDGECAPEGDR